MDCRLANQAYEREIAFVATPFGEIQLSASGGVLLDIEVLPAGAEVAQRKQVLGNGLLKEAVEQILRYLDDPSVQFVLPLRSQGTPFQQGVWQVLRQIPAGRTLSYGELAKCVRSGPRAVASACKSNRFPIIIPCHRVVSARGLGGYCGKTDGPMLEIKRWLLGHEGYFLGEDRDSSV